MDSAQSTLILGIGNLLMGDEGVGVHAARLFEKEKLPTDVHVLDGGTGGFHLLSTFQEHQTIILIDATMDGREPGSVHVTQPKFASDFPKTLSAHDIGLRDLIESAALIGTLPRLFLVTVSIDKISSMVMELSPPVKESLPKIVETVRSILKNANHSS
jgi:hydrogenase maturation protease